MSAIFGIFNLDGRPVDLKNLYLMKQSMVYWGRDGSGEWSQGSVGLSHLMLRNTPESHFETQPFRYDGDRFVITANVRLDNRKFLFHILDIPVDDWDITPDVVLLIKSYEKWGRTSTEHLLGDWAFALWDANQRRLFLARDPMGNAGLYYYRNDRSFIFASSLKGILSLPDIPHRLNMVALAQLGPTGKRDASTFYQGIFQLSPGQAMEVSVVKTDAWYYWHPKDIPDIRFSADQDYVDAFMAIYKDAISCRLRSSRPVGILLSSGLDSGSVATLAAHELARKNHRLLAFSWRPKYDITDTVAHSRLGDESRYVEEICSFVGNIDVRFTHSKGFRPLEGVKRILGILEQPMYQEAASYWLLSLLAEAQQQNTGILLHGMWGNITVSWDGDRNRYLKNIFELAAMLSPWRKQSRLKRRGDHFGRSLIRSEAALPILEANPMVDPELAERHRQAQQPLRSIYNMFQSGSLSSISEMGAAFGLELRTPMTDKRIVEFCLGIPMNQYIRKGRDRLLIRRAMSGLMPEHILWNQRRGMIGGDIGKQYRDDYAEMEDTLHQLEKSPLAQYWLDLPRMNHILKSVNQKLTPTVLPEFNLLLRGIMVGLFLMRFKDE
ncbi:MAG: hypothetical protein HQK65_05845 [Desulfamplus sp.]|nr:hypothetical protein [Desulfamplus sp.]